MIVKLFVLALLVLRIDGQLEQCFVDTHSPYVYFSSKTSYYASRKSEIIVPEKCSPTYLWALIRHGTRYPDSEFIDSMKSLYSLRDEIVKNHREGRGKLCIKDLENLEKWSSNVTADVAGDLTAQGVKDVISLAQRLKEKFPNLLKSTFHNSFLFESSSCLRAKKSAIAFSNELLDTNYQDTNGNSIIENEGLLHIIKYCEAYTNEVENNNLTYKEATLFQDTELVKKVISEISERLGFKQQLSFDLVKVMHGICAYESAWYINSRPAFCAAFLPDHLKVFEYYNDMKYYYVNGYGTPLTEKIGCIMVKDMMTSLSKAAENIEETPKATFYFSHSEMILPTTVKLGLNRDDEASKHDNYDLMKDDRKWRLASFDSFAANIIAVLYKCSSPDGDQNKVIFYQNERQIELPKCAQNSCILENLLQNFPEVFNETQCNLNFCESESVKGSKGNLISFNVNVFLVVFFMCRYVL